MIKLISVGGRTLSPLTHMEFFHFAVVLFEIFILLTAEPDSKVCLSSKFRGF